jgi:hypothetical protein
MLRPKINNTDRHVMKTLIVRLNNIREDISHRCQDWDQWEAISKHWQFFDIFSFQKDNQNVIWTLFIRAYLDIIGVRFSYIFNPFERVSLAALFSILDLTEKYINNSAFL